MSELYDDIRNLSAVLDLLHRENQETHRPVLRLACDHLRLLARQMEGPFPCCLPPVPQGSHGGSHALQ
ncbi:MAG: hypothetical protein Q4F27_04650 [Desulfovibrionaceae bacterium]|nr:hypothetical protein [Desulfovibrionaceae bacterium]